MQQQQTNNQNNLTFLKSNYKYKRRNMRTTRALPLKARKPNQLAATLSKAKTSAATAATAIAAAVGTTICRKCSTILILFIVIIWKTLQAMANCLHYTGRIIANANGHNDVDYVADADDDGNAYVNASHDHDVNAASVRHSQLHSHSLSHSHSHPYSRTSHVSYRNNNNNNDKFDANDEVSTAREQQQQQRQHQQQQRQQHQQQQQIQQQQQNLSSSSPQKCSRCTTTPAATASSLIATTTTRDMSSVAGKSGLPLMTLLIALLLSMRLASAGTCWQTHLGSGKCNQIFSTNITKSDCCGASQTFSYTDRELSSVEYFFATAIGGGVECAPCIETCKGFKCGPNKKCVKRKGRPKCVCAPECGATLRRKQQQLQQQQHHSVTEQQQQQWASSLLSSSMTTRGSRSLSSEILSSNLSDDINNNKNSKNGADNQRKQQKQQQQQEQRPQRMPKRESQARGAQGETKHRRLLIIDSGSSSSTNLQKQPTTRRLRMEHTSNSNSNSSRGRGSGGKVQMQMKVEMERMTPPLPGAVRGNERRGHKKIKSTSSNSSKSSDSNNNGKHLTRSMTTATGANDSSATPAQTAQSRHKLANANEPANDINRQPQQQHQQQQQHQDNASARVRHQHQQQKQKHQQQQKHYGPNHEQQYDNETQQQQRRRSKHKHNHKDQQRKATNTTMSGFGFGSGSGSGSSGRRRLYLAEPGSETAASSSLSSHGHLDNADDLAFLAGIYEPAPMQQQHQHRQQQHSNPVCGSDGRTYNTECQLRKRACRTNNAQLEVAYRGHCKTSCNGVQCINGLSCVEDQYMMPHCISCKIECPWDDIAYDLDGDGRADDSPIVEERAVCGVDGKTYKSTCDINRMICKIGRSIAVAYPGPCRADRVTCADIKCGTKDTCLVDLQTHKPRCVSCRYKCARKQHRTPFRADKLCGNNNHTYNSWCEMRKDSCATGYYIGVRSTGVC